MPRGVSREGRGRWSSLSAPGDFPYDAGMSTTDTTKSSPLRTVAISAVVLLLLLVVLAVFRRAEYPDGTFLIQQRTYFAGRVNPDLGDVLAGVVPGETTTAELTEKLGEPTGKAEEDDLELWVYTMRTKKVTERLLFGLIRTGGSSDAVESRMPVGVKGGVVVHTYLMPSEDPSVKKAVEAMWDAYTSGT